MKAATFRWGIAFLLCYSIVFTTMAQDETSPVISTDHDKGSFFTGGSLGMQFGTSTFIDISPQLGYFATKKFAIGVGATYQYMSYNVSTNIYGGRLFARYYLFPRIFAHAEYEMLNLEKFDYAYVGSPRVNVESFLVGGGYREQMGDRLSFNIMLLYNLTESPYSPSSNPVIRMGVDIGI